MNRFKKVFVSLSVAFLVACCGLVILFNWSALGWKALSVPTSSMSPAISPGSLVLVHSVPNNSLKVGDVITYTNPRDARTTITHRIAKTYTLPGSTIPAYITKGDANPAADIPVVGGQIQGKVVRHVPYLGSMMMWSKTWVGMGVLVYLPALFIMVEEMLVLSAYYRKYRPYESAGLILKKLGYKKDRTNLKPAMTVSLAALIIPIVVAFPVAALLRSNTVALAPNNITVAGAVPPVEGPHVTIRKIVLRCSASNTVSKNVRPLIVIQNWTHQNFVANGWRVEDNSGTIFNIPDGFQFKKLRQYKFTPLLSDGLQYSGDRLVIKNGQGQTVDALSWGADTTAFTPSVQNVTSGDRVERRPFHVDTDVAADWRVTDHRCWCPEHPDVEDGSDAGEFGDASELNRANVPGVYNLEEE